MTDIINEYIRNVEHGHQNYIYSIKLQIHTLIKQIKIKIRIIYILIKTNMAIK